MHEPCRTGIHAYRDWKLSSKFKLFMSVLSVSASFYIKPTQIKVIQENNLGHFSRKFIVILKKILIS